MTWQRQRFPTSSPVNINTPLSPVFISNSFDTGVDTADTSVSEATSSQLTSFDLSYHTCHISHTYHIYYVYHILLYLLYYHIYYVCYSYHILLIMQKFSCWNLMVTCWLMARIPYIRVLSCASTKLGWIIIAVQDWIEFHLSSR